MVKIKGEILVHRALVSSSLGDRGFLSSSAFCIYGGGMYFNINAPFFLRELDNFLIPFERISELQDGFVFDFESVCVSFTETVIKPEKENGWIGPHKFKRLDFDWHRFYSKFSTKKLFDAYLEYLYNGEVFHSDIILDVFIKKYPLYLRSLNISELRNEEKYILNSLENFESNILNYDLDSLDKEYVSLFKSYHYLCQNEIHSAIENCSDLNLEELVARRQKAIDDDDFEKLSILDQQIKKKGSK